MRASGGSCSWLFNSGADWFSDGGVPSAGGTAIAHQATVAFARGALGKIAITPYTANFTTSMRKYVDNPG